MNARIFTDPVRFQERCLGRRLWEKQREIVRSVDANLLTAVKGCHASGKTYVASGLPLHQIIRYPQGKAFTTSPTLRQVKMFWEEIALARRSSPTVSQLIPEPTTTGLRIAEDNYAVGASSSRGVNVQGLHGRHVLIIADEAPGIEADIWDAIEGIRAGGSVRVLKMGNPVVPSGAFFDAFNVQRKIHKCISISAFDTPNLQNELTGHPLTIEELLQLSDERLTHTPFPSLITRQWVKERYLVWGPTHPKYLSRVLAEFPSSDPNSVFPLAWIERAKREPTEGELREAKRIGRIQVGIDVAGAGKDETVLYARIGPIILEHQAWSDADPRGQVVTMLKRLQNHPEYPLGLVVVDIVGIGYNFALHLADQGFPVYGFNAGARAIDPTQFANQKAEAHFAARGYFEAGLVAGLDDEETEGQLATIRYRETSRGVTEIETKEQRNKRGIPGSPDRAEALIMAFMRVTAQRTTIPISSPDYQISPI